VSKHYIPTVFSQQACENEVTFLWEVRKTVANPGEWLLCPGAV